VKSDNLTWSAAGGDHDLSSVADGNNNLPSVAGSDHDLSSVAVVAGVDHVLYSWLDLEGQVQ
jgi:hypothetical protein